MSHDRVLDLTSHISHLPSAVIKLILFDIDGTLLWTDGAGRRAMQGALASVFGTSGADGYRYDGKTDGQIVRETMRIDGHADDRIEELLPRALAEYVARLGLELAKPETGRRRYDGVLELLDALEAREDRIVGLLTGNLIDGATRKLNAVGIDPARFRIGAFGSDHEHRPELPAIAMQRALESLGHLVPGERIVIIGDTPADIECGRGIGARAIAVATGRYSVEELASHDPVAVFADLRDTAAVMRAIDEA